MLKIIGLHCDSSVHQFGATDKSLGLWSLNLLYLFAPEWRGKIDYKITVDSLCKTTLNRSQGKNYIEKTREKCILCDHQYRTRH